MKKARQNPSALQQKYKTAIAGHLKGVELRTCRREQDKSPVVPLETVITMSTEPIPEAIQTKNDGDEYRGSRKMADDGG